MNRSTFSLVVLLLLVMIPLGSATKTILADDESNTTKDLTPEMSKINQPKPKIYHQDGILVLEGLRDTVIDQSTLDKMQLGLDAVTSYDNADSNSVFTQSYTGPVFINAASNITIKDSTFSNINENYALRIVNSNDIKIINNDFANITSDDNNVDTTPTTDLQVVRVTDSPGLIFQDNTFEDLDVNTTLDITVFTMSGSSNSIISGNTINNNANSDGDYDFTGYSITTSNNISIYDNWMYYIYGNNVNFIDVSNSNQVNYYDNTFSDSVFLGGSGFNFSSVDFIKSNESNLVAFLTIGEGSGFIGFVYDTVNHVAENYTFVGYATIQDGDFIAIQMTNSNNITLSWLDHIQITNAGNRIIGFDISDSTDIDIYSMNMNQIISTATGIDLDNSQSIYGAFVDNSEVILNASNFNSFDSNSQLFGIYMEDSKIISISNEFVYYEGSVIHGNVIVRGLAGSQFNDSYFAVWEGSQIYGIEVYDTIASILFFDYYFSSFLYTTFGQGISVDNSAHLYFLDLYLYYIRSYAPFFETSLLSLENSFNLTLERNTFYAIYSYYTQMSTIKSNNISDSTFYLNYFYFNYAWETAFIGMYHQYSTGLNISHNTLYYILSFATQSSILSIDLVDDKIGYGIVLEGTNSSTISNSVVTQVAQWYLSDDSSTGIVLSENTIGGLEDYVTTFDKPADLIYDADEDAGATLTWTATTAQANQTANYTITMNGNLVQEGNWTSGQPITYQLSGLQFGTYTIIIELVQTNGFVTTDVVLVTATELTPPSIISRPSDLTTVENSDTKLIWEVYELNPTSYSIYRDDIEIEYDFYQQNDTIEYSLKDTPLGTHNISLTLRDEAGNEISDTLTVQIVEASPISIELVSSEITYELGSANVSIDFTVFGTIGGNFIVSAGESDIDSGEWTDGVPVSYDISGLLVGQYFYSFFVIDSIGNTAEFDVIINVIPLQEDVVEDEDNVLEDFSEFFQGIRDVEFTADNIIPLAAAAFVGGAIFFPGMKIIKNRSAKLAENVGKKSGKK